MNTTGNRRTMKYELRRAVFRFLRVGILATLFLPASAAFGQVAPVVTSLNPPSVQAGGPGFTLRVTGLNFAANSVVRVNGSNRTTIFLGATQVQATVLSSDIAGPGSLAITVFTPVAGVPGGGVSSNTAILAVTTTGPPTLTGAAPGSASGGASQIRLTLVGTNFRPGATVVISPPMPNVSGSTGTVQATDISVDEVAVVSTGLIVAILSVSPSAPASLRAVDVLNTDGTNTGISPTGGPGTSKPLRITGGSALGAPLSVTTLAVTNPRNGALINQGEQTYGEVALAGTGSGTVIGAWYWDGKISEQFVASFAGGQRVTVRAQHSFPTSLLGVHTVELRILQPNRVASRPITVVVNPGDLPLENLLNPPSGARTTPEELPQFRWAPVPGIAKYEIGFSTRPYYSSIKTWHEVTDNQWAATQDVWGELPDGELYWTVRAVEMSGAKRKPLPMRLLLRFPSGALCASSPRPSLTPQGHPLLEWKGLEGRHLYQITISEDEQGAQILRRYLSRTPSVDLRALKGKLDPAKTYYWFVEALDPDGLTMLTGPVQVLVFTASSSNRYSSPGTPHFVLTSYSVPSRTSPEAIASPEPPAEIKTLITRAPAQDTTVPDPKAQITIEFSTAPNVFDLSIQIDGTDVTSLAVAAETKIAYTPATPLADGAHSVTITLGADSSSWKFNSKAAAPPPSTSARGTTDAEPAPGKGNGGKERTGPLQTQTQITMNTEWVSGSAGDTNTLSVGEQLDYQAGSWKVQINGSGLVNSVLGPENIRGSLGRVNNYIFQSSAQSGNWGLHLRFGIVAPSMYQNAQFVTTATPHQGIETNLKTPGGTFGFYANTDDQASGGGSGFAFHQQLLGAGWDLPLPKKYFELRLMWLSAQDTGNATTIQTDFLGQTYTSSATVDTPGGGDLYGALLAVHLSPKWLWSSEYAWGYNDSNTFQGLFHLFGRAWRTGVGGTAGPATLNLSYSEVGPNFASPANPSLSFYSTPDRRGPTATVGLTTHIGTFTLGDTYQQSNFNEAYFAEQGMNALTESWSKNLDKITIMSVSAHQTSVTTINVPPAVRTLPLDQQLALEADQRDEGANVNLTRQVGKTLSLSVGGARDWFRDNLVQGANTITSSIIAGANWTARSYFQLNANVSSNWVAGEKSAVGETRNLSGYLQPTFAWKRAGLQVQPIASVNQSRTQLLGDILSNNMLTQQYGGRVVWNMPGEFKFSTLSMEGDYASSKNPVFALSQRGTTLFLLWTISWGHKQVF